MAKKIGSVVSFRTGLHMHYKGGLYRALHVVQHHETGESFVVYLSMTHPEAIKLRELDSEGKDSWCDILTLDENETCIVVPSGVLHSPGQPFPRFRWMGP